MGTRFELSYVLPVAAPSYLDSDIPAVKSQPFWESYEPTSGNEIPPSRYGHVSVATEDHIIMFVPLSSLHASLVMIICRFGGHGKRGYLNDTWSFDTSTRKWTELQCIGSIPPPRPHHAAVLVDDVMYVVGGVTTKMNLDDLYALQLSSE